MRSFFYSVISILLTVIITSSEATTRKVPQEYAKIQLAINAAVNGDTVLVAEGTYLENIRITKKIVVASLFITDNNKSHITNTVINGSTPSHPDSGSVVTIEGDVDTTTILKGFTITGGKGNKRYVSLENIFFISGGGIDIYAAGGARISNNIIRNNIVGNSSGVTNTGAGGISVGYDGKVSNYTIIEYNTIVGNTVNGTYGEGGGLGLMTNGRLIGNNISKNVSTTHAGGISILGGCTLLLQDNYISGNSALTYGGGIFAYYYKKTLQQPRITMQNNILSANSSSGGAAFRLSGGDICVINNTITNHTGVNNAIRIWAPTGATASFRIMNSIVWNPSLPTEIFANSGSDYASYNIIRDNSMGGNNGTNDPNFIPDDTLYRLADNSPAVGKGIIAAVLGNDSVKISAKDYIGNSRIQPGGSYPDLGAIEHENGVLLLAQREGVNVETPKYKTFISNVGHIGELNNFQDAGGFSVYGVNVLFEGAFMIATDMNHVSYGCRSSYSLTALFNPGFRPLQSITKSTNGSQTTTTTAIDDSNQFNPIGVKITQRTVSDTANNKSGYLMYLLFLENQTSTPITNLHIGSYFDLDITPEAVKDRGQIVKDSLNTIPGVNNGLPFKFHLIYQTNEAKTHFFGVVPLSQSVFKAARVVNQVFEFPSNDSLKYGMLSEFRNFNPYGDDGIGVDYGIISSLAANLNDAAMDTVSFAIVIGTSLDELLTNARQAQKDYVELGGEMKLLTNVKNFGSELLPEIFSLEQNYPNPFNPSTKINYQLPINCKVSLRIYDLLGREVATLVNEEQSAGWKEVEFQSTVGRGQLVSGVYFYKLHAGNFIEIKKMLMIK